MPSIASLDVFGAALQAALVATDAARHNISATRPDAHEEADRNQRRYELLGELMSDKVLVRLITHELMHCVLNSKTAGE